jgi:hypothetical protein
MSGCRNFADNRSDKLKDPDVLIADITIQYLGSEAPAVWNAVLEGVKFVRYRRKRSLLPANLHQSRSVQAVECDR